jgi:hypothetical protein
MVTSVKVVDCANTIALGIAIAQGIAFVYGKSGPADRVTASRSTKLAVDQIRIEVFEYNGVLVSTNTRTCDPNPDWETSDQYSRRPVRFAQSREELPIKGDDTPW